MVLVKAFEATFFEIMSKGSGATPGSGGPGPFGTLGLRPEEPQDQAFLFELYASTRREELDAWGWPPQARAAFLRMQFQASQGYRTTVSRC